jgi:predicted 3-demethylubiquinone-9 3-methyltransferase (glyoxalase superfamily)
MPPWRIVRQIRCAPIALIKAVTTPDSAAAKRAFDVMMQMRKIVIAAIEVACRR